MLSRETYGRPRMYAELRDDGWLVNHKRVGRLMSQEGLQGASRRKKWRTTKRAKDARPAPDLVERNFGVDGPDQLWVADITYVPTSSGFLYLAVVVDAWSRRVVGWSMKTYLRTDLVLDALNMALQQRRPGNVIHHSDQGTQPRIQEVVATPCLKEEEFLRFHWQKRLADGRSRTSRQRVFLTRSSQPRDVRSDPQRFVEPEVGGPLSMRELGGG